MSLFLKICGLRTPEAVAVALDGGASHVGFIFFPKSPRNVSPHEAAALREPVRGRAAAVAVSVDADDALLQAIVDEVRPDILQLHGHETPERVSAVRARFGLPVIKALPVRDEADLRAAGRYAGIADHLLFDAKPPPDAALPGGNGIAFDWTLLDAAPAAPFFLSGGLNRANLAEALRSRPAGLDVSSGVESAPGVKDLALIRAFLGEARALSQEFRP